MTSRTLAERLWSRVDQRVDGCWAWTGSTANGYGVIGAGGRGGPTLRTHRVAYELMIGPIPDGLHIDHLCRNRVCCNPAHLEAVTQAENNRRAFLDHDTCPRGHALPPKTAPSIRRPQCSVCKSAYDKARYESMKEAS